MSVMDIKGLTFAYPSGKEILHGIDLTIEEGEFVLLCGPSGCGKTTFLRCMKRKCDQAFRERSRLRISKSGESDCH